MKALVGAFNQEKALVGAFSVIVQPVVEPMDQFAALRRTQLRGVQPRHGHLGPHEPHPPGVEREARVLECGGGHTAHGGSLQRDYIRDCKD